MTANPVGHLDPYFVELMDQTMEALRKVFRTVNHHTIPISGTGSAGLEAIMMNLLESGDEAVVVINGYFGQRLAELARRAGASVRTVESAPGEIADPADQAERGGALLRRAAVPDPLYPPVHADFHPDRRHEP